MGFKKGNTIGNRFGKGNIPHNKGKKNPKHSEFMAGRFVGEKSVKYSKITFKCLVCGKDFMDQKLRNRKFCSRNCYWSNLIGHSLSEETCRRLSESKRLEKHWNWKGGKSFEPYPMSFNIKLKKLIRGRDKYTCQICKNEGRCVHHIDYNKKNCEPSNLITLCRGCHTKTNKYREYWTQYFYGLLK